MQEKSPRHQAALDWAAAGIPVFPCVRNAKRPACPNGYKDSTTDLSRIDAWWSEDDYNPAISPELAGLAAIDVEATGLTAWQTEHGVIPTRTHRTPRGGIHLLFEGSLPTTAKRLAPDVDTRGAGGYILLPPSIVGGQAYEVLDDRDCAPLPSWVRDSLARANERLSAAVEDLDLPGNIDRARHTLAMAVERGDIAKEGCGGDDRTYRLACELLDLGLSPERALALLVEIWNPHCEPPWEPEELALKLENAGAYHQNETGAYACPPAAEVFANAAQEAAKDAPKPRNKFHVEDDEEQDQGAEPSWLIPNVIPDKAAVLMIGPPMSYKSFLSLDLALALGAGTSTFGVTPVPAPGPVFYAALEGLNGVKKSRKWAWKEARGVPKVPKFYTLAAPLLALDDEVQAFGDAMRDKLAGRPCGLIVLDTLSQIMSGMNENDVKDASRFVRFVHSLVEAFGCTVIVIHHTGKDEARGARGSSAFFAGFDAVLECKGEKDTKSVDVWVRKFKDAEVPKRPISFKGRSVGKALVFDVIDQRERLAALQDADPFDAFKVARVLHALKARPGSPVTSDVLVSELLPHIQDESEDDRQTALGRAKRTLHALSRNKLEVYCSRAGRDLLWCLPETTEA